MNSRKQLIAALSLTLIALGMTVAKADVQSITWLGNPFPVSNEVPANQSTMPAATASSGATIDYRILDSSGSNCAFDGTTFTYDSGDCIVQATARASGSFTPTSTTRWMHLSNTLTPSGTPKSSRGITGVPADETITTGNSILLTNAGVSAGLGNAVPIILESADSGCYLDGLNLYAPHSGTCYVSYLANQDPSYYLTISSPQIITVLPAPAPAVIADPVNINIVAPPAEAAPVLQAPGVPVELATTEPVQVLVATSSGSTIAVTAPAGVLPDKSTLTVTPTTAPEAIKSGLLQVEVNAFDSSGARITQLNQVLSINLGKLKLEGNAVAYSQDGLVWHTIEKIDGTVLPEGVGEGYYLDANGSVVILTRHLTFYGTKRLAKDLILLAPSLTREIGTQLPLKLQGGSGTGALTYISLTPKICSITQKGVVTALSAGECSVDAVKNGDSVYSSSTSGPLLLTIKAKSVRVFTVGKKITVQSSLSDLYANTNVDLYLLDHASRSTGFVQKIASSGRGSIRFTFLPNSLPKAFTIEVKNGDQLLATTIGSRP